MLNMIKKAFLPLREKMPLKCFYTTAREKAEKSKTRVEHIHCFKDSENYDS